MRSYSTCLYAEFSSDNEHQQYHLHVPISDGFRVLFKRLVAPQLLNIENKIVQRLECSENLTLCEGILSDYAVLL